MHKKCLQNDGMRLLVCNFELTCTFLIVDKAHVCKRLGIAVLPSCSIVPVEQNLTEPIAKIE